MDERELEIMIPSGYVRKHVRESGWRFTDRERASLLYHADIPWREQCRRLEGLQLQTGDGELKRQILAYLDKARVEYATFKENNNRSHIYILKIREEGGYWNGEYLTSGYFFDWETAYGYGKKEAVPFGIEKYFAGGKKNSMESGSEECGGYTVAYLYFNEKGDEQYFGSLGMENDIGGDFYTNFRTAFYKVPNPFERGDIVRMAWSEKYGIVETSQKRWKENTVKFQSPENGQKADYSDVQIRVAFLNKDGTFSHEHINPIVLERYWPEHKADKQEGSARDDLLLAAGAMYRNDDTADSIASLDELYYFTMEYRKEVAG